MILDTHSHIIPGVDDGAKSFQESIKILEMMKKQGVDVVVATPHLNLLKPSALQKREKVLAQYNELCQLTENINVPQIYLGYELVFSYGMSEDPNLDKFTIAGTDKILIELPFGRMTNRIIAELEEITFTRKLTPVLAHLERYTQFEGVDRIYDAIYSGVAEAQITADTVDGFWNKITVGKLLKKDIFTYLGSDSHSIDERPPKMDTFLKYVQRHHKYFYNQMLIANKNLYKDMKKPTI